MNYKTEKISIALCSYNGAKYISDQLESIALQTQLPDELVICDDSSTDDTISIIKSFQSKASFPIILKSNQNNIGSTKNFEKAISLCTGDIILLSDQDDLWHTNKINHILDVFKNNSKVGLVFSDGEVVDESLHPLGYSLWEARKLSHKDQLKIKKGDFLKVLFQHYDHIVTGATMGFRSDYKKLILPIDAEWVHDAWIAFLIAAVSGVDVVAENLIKYRQHTCQQIGMKQITLKSQLSAIAIGDRSGYEHQLRRYKATYQRLISHAGEYLDQNKLAHIEQKLQLIHFRSNMPKRKIERIPPVLKELMRLSYHRCAKGFLSAFRDIMFLLLFHALVIYEAFTLQSLGV